MPDNQEDLLILMGLSIMLLRLSYGSLPEDTDWRIVVIPPLITVLKKWERSIDCTDLI